MDFVELQAIEGLRWSWNAWPTSKSEASSLVIPLSVMHTPLMRFNDLPLLSYEPLTCSGCTAALNPYARLDFASRIWGCPFCYHKNIFPRSYAGISETNLPAELFPTYSTVEYTISRKISNFTSNSNLNANHNWINGLSHASPFSSSLPLLSSSTNLSVARVAFVFIVDICTNDEELKALKMELLLAVAQLPENALLGLITFDSMVYVHDLAFSDCSRVVLLHGERELSPDQTQKLLGIHHQTSNHHHQHLGKIASIQNQEFLVSVSDCEFSFTTAIEEIHSSTCVLPGHRPQRCTGSAISAAVGLLEGSLTSSSSHIMVFTSGPSTRGPGIIVLSDLTNPIRTHRDINSGHASFYENSCTFYRNLSHRLLKASIVLNFFACSLDQVGLAELRFPIECSGGFMTLSESFKSDQFKKCLRHIFRRDPDGNLDMCSDITIEILTSKDIKIAGALGPCASLEKNGTNHWRMCSMTHKTSIAFFFEVVNQEDNKPQGSVFFLQFITCYRYGNTGIIRKRVTTVARRWVKNSSPELGSGFDQEAAASIMARLAVDRADRCYARDVIRWLDKKLVSFASKFGNFINEDASSFRLSPNFSLYPQFMYYLRRSQFIDVSNHSPDETAFYRLMLNREGVVETLIMIQPTLLQYSFFRPPKPVLLDVRSVSPDVILLFDSYFHVVIHYGSRIALWKKNGFCDKDVDENLRRLVEVIENDAEQLVGERVPMPKLIKCEQHSRQARFLLAKLNPSVTHNSGNRDGGEIVFSDDLSLEVFMDHLQELAVQG